MKDSELLAEIKAKAELEAMGWRLVECPMCKGIGVAKYNFSDPNTPVWMKAAQATISIPEIECSACNGRGTIWKSPEPSPIVHKCPEVDGGVTQCCGKSPFELPEDDQITTESSVVTCNRKIK